MNKKNETSNLIDLAGVTISGGTISQDPENINRVNISAMTLYVESANYNANKTKRNND